MKSVKGQYSLPRWRFTRWLADAGPNVPDDVRKALVAGLFGSFSVFLGGAINTVAMAAIIALRVPSTLVLIWFVLETATSLGRLTLFIIANRAARAGRPTPTDLHLLLAVAWSASVGFGVVASLASGDWVVALLACQSAAAMVGGICFRHFGAPRLAGTMILLSLGPIIPGAILANEPLFYIVFLQMPMYLASMTNAAFRLNRMLVATMRSERENSHLAHHDVLTGLWNRAGFVDALETKLKATGPGGAPFALLFFDLDHFKPVNDTYGHAAGDDVLRLVAKRLRNALPDTDVIARMGGDEFVILANDVTAEQALAIGNRIIGEVAKPYELGDGVSAKVGVSVGIAMSPDHGTEAEELLAVADAALYEAKSTGRARCRLASVETNLTALRRLTRNAAASASATGAAA